MSTERRCSQSDLPISMCAHCRPQTEDDFDTEPEIVGPVFSASYPGFCVAGFDHIEEGDSIGRANLGGYMHESCGTTTNRNSRRMA